MANTHTDGPTRLIVLQLPSSATTEQLRSHFSELERPITDARVLFRKDGQSRRIGFLGFANHGDAEAAKTWFDGTWMHGSRIKVDFAQAIGDAEPPRKRLRASGPSDIPAGNATRAQESSTSDFGLAGSATASTTQQATTAAEDSELTDAEYLARRQKRSIDEDQMNGAPEATLASTDASLGSMSPTRGIGMMPDASLEDEIAASSRLFLRNLSFDVSESDVRDAFSSFGEITECRIVLSAGGVSRGLAYLTFVASQDALRAYRTMDKSVLQGRVLHILPARPAHSATAEDFVQSTGKTGTTSSYALKKASKRGAEKERSFNWSSLFLNSNAVMDSIAARLDSGKAELLQPQSSQAASRLALAEMHLVRETKEHLRAQGISLEVLEHGQISLSATVIIKNLPYATRFAVVKSLIGAHGEIKRLVLPPAGVLAIAEMASADQARKVVQSLAYSKMNGSIIYAERLPDNLWQLETTSSSDDITAPQGSMPAGEPDPSLFVVNLPRDITKQTLAASFTSFPGLLGVTLPGSQAESKGYAFVHFETAAQAEVALSGMHGTVIGGRTVRMTFSQKKAASQEYVAAPDKAASTHKDAQSTQLVLKNLPFESTRQDLLDILSVFGTVRTLRLPKKSGNSLRGFAFVQYASENEARAALDGLKHSHYLGRHIVAEWTARQAS